MTLVKEGEYKPESHSPTNVKTVALRWTIGYYRQ